MLRSLKELSRALSSSPLHSPSPSSITNRRCCHSKFSRSYYSSVSLLGPKSRRKKEGNNRHHHHHQCQQLRLKTFVSKHASFDLTANQILETCCKYGILPSVAESSSALPPKRLTPTHVILKKCPFCSKPTYEKVDNFYKCYIQVGSGAFFCHRCGHGGSWYDFKNTFTKHDKALQTSGIQVPSASNNNYGRMATQNSTYTPAAATMGKQYRNSISASRNNIDHHNVLPPLPMPQVRLQACYSSNLLDYDTSNNVTYGGSSGSASDVGAYGSNGNSGGGSGSGSSNDNETKTNYCNAVLDYLQNKRGFDKSTLRMYGVGRATYNFPDDEGNYIPADCVTFPWFMTKKQVEEQEHLRLDNNNNNNGHSSEKDNKKGKEKDSDNTKNDDNTFLTRRIKVRAIQNKGWQRMDPPGGGWGLFGWHMVPKDAKEIIITEGEYDAMAIYQITKRPAVSLPSGCRNLPIEILPMLERFDKIYLWMDNDEPGRQGCDKFARKIGLNRCYIVTPPSLPSKDTATFETNKDFAFFNNNEIKDANDILMKVSKNIKNVKNSEDIPISKTRAKNIVEQMLRSAKNIQHQNILTFDDLRSDVLHEILHPEQYVGVPIPSLPTFSNTIKGFRRGELTVITGPTGSGKTTFLGQVSLDLCEQKTNVLWGSFEIKNTRLIRKLLQQFSREPLQNLLEQDPNANAEKKYQKLEALADRFNDLPMQYMKFHGGSDIDDVIDAMDYATYVNDAECIILDNMQFMISRNHAASNKSFSSFDKFDVQDIAIEKFRKFATERNVHIVLVVHPRKEQECSKLNISSIYGSAKATQEADTVLIIQQQQADGNGYNTNNSNTQNRKYIEVKKNRFDGTLGHSLLFFDRSSGRYTEHPPENRPLAA